MTDSSKSTSIKRIDVSFLRRGAAIDLHDLDESDCDHHRDQAQIAFDRKWLPATYANGYDCVLVDYLIRDEANNYRVVPMVTQTFEREFAKGNASIYPLSIDTRYIRRVISWRGTRKHTAPVVDEVYAYYYDEGDEPFSGEQAMQMLAGFELSKNIRPNGLYIWPNQICRFLCAQVLKHHPRADSYLDMHSNADLLETAGAALWASFDPVTAIDVDTQETRAVIKIDRKALRKWLKRNQSRFYSSSLKMQRVVDEQDALMLAAEKQMLREQAEDAARDVQEEMAEVFDQELDEEAGMGLFNEV